MALDLGGPIEVGSLLAFPSNSPLPLMASVYRTLIKNVEHVDPLQLYQAVLYFKGACSFVVLFVFLECLLGRLNLIYHQSRLHVALEGVNAPPVFVREGVHRELKLWKIGVLKRLLEQLAANVLADAIGIQEFTEINRAQLQKLLDAGIENDGVLGHHFLALDLGELLEEVRVDFGSVVALVEQSPTDGTHQIHVKLTEARLNTEEVVLVLLPLVLAAGNAGQERQYQGSAVYVNQVLLARFRRIEPALQHATHEAQVIVEECEQVGPEELGSRVEEEIEVLVPEDVHPNANSRHLLINQAVVQTAVALNDLAKVLQQIQLLVLRVHT